jgi:hypothetical protein
MKLSPGAAGPQTVLTSMVRDLPKKGSTTRRCFVSHPWIGSGGSPVDSGWLALNILGWCLRRGRKRRNIIVRVDLRL